MKLKERLKKVFSSNNLTHHIDGVWEGSSYNIKGYKHKQLPNYYQLIFTLKLIDSQKLTGFGKIIPTDENGKVLESVTPTDVTVEGLNFQISKIINFYTKNSANGYQGTCILKGSLNESNTEEGHAVGYNVAGEIVVVSHVKFKKKDKI